MIRRCDSSTPTTGRVPRALASAFLVPVDPPSDKGTQTLNDGTLFFGPHGNLWSFSDGTGDGYSIFRASTLSGQSPFDVDGTVAIGSAFVSNWTWPLYTYFSFHPQTGQLFATFVVGADANGKPLP
jgi:hypothetical protein